MGLIANTAAWEWVWQHLWAPQPTRLLLALICSSHRQRPRPLRKWIGAAIGIVIGGGATVGAMAICDPKTDGFKGSRR